MSEEQNEFEILDSLADEQVLLVSVSQDDIGHREGNYGFHGEYLRPWDEKAKGKRLVTVDFVEGCDEHFTKTLNKTNVKKLAEELLKLHDLMVDE